MKMSHAGLKSPCLTVLLASLIKSVLTAQELRAARGFLDRFPASVCTSTLTCPKLGQPCRGERGFLGKGGNLVSSLLTSAARPGLWPLQASAVHCSSRARTVPWVRVLARWAICYTGTGRKTRRSGFLDSERLRRSSCHPCNIFIAFCQSPGKLKRQFNESSFIHPPYTAPK